MSVTLPEQIAILHVDDEPDFADLTGTFLEREDDPFTVETATSADEGLVRITDRLPDCVVSDYNMPGMDGIEFLQAVREKYPDLPFILYTGKGSEAVASEAIAADVTDYLQKGSGSEQYELLANRILNAVETRREAERADRQEQLMRLTEFAGDTGGFELDTETGKLLMTDGVRRLINLPSQADLTLDEAIDLYHPEDREDIRQTIDRACQTGEQTHGTWRLQTQDGNERTVDVTFTPATTDGDTEILRGSIHDITNQHERQQELESERRFITQALDAMDDLFYVIDTDGTLRRWNETALEITGYSESELDGLPAIELFPEDERETVSKSIEATLTDGEARVNADLLTADGQRIPYEFTGGRLTDADGNTTGLVGIGRDLTERRQRERRFRALVEESNDIISIIDADGRFQYQSPSIERILGHDPEETVGDKVWEYIHPDDRERIEAVFETWVATGETPEPIEYRARHADGSWHWMEARPTNQLDNPAIEGYAVNSSDITDRKEREQELERTNDLMSNMEELADVGAWEYDSETDRLMLTDGTRWIHGLDPDADLTVEAAFETFHPDDRDLLEDRFDECLETGEPYEMDVRLTTPDGEQRRITARGERVTGDESGDVVRGYIRDITERKERQQELRRNKRAMDEAPVGITISDPSQDDHPLTYVNDRFEELTGYDEDEILGRNWQFLHGDNTREEPVAQIREAIDAQDPVTVELRNYRKDGTEFWNQVSIAPVYDDQGSVVNFVGFQQDITDRKQRKRDLRQERDLVTGIFETSPVGIAVVTADGDLSLVNEQSSTIAGWSDKAVTDTSYNHSRYDVVNEDGDPFDAGETPFDRVMSHETAIHDQVVGTRRPSGERVWLSVSGAPQYNDDGELEQAVFAFEDITEQRELEAELSEILGRISDGFFALNEEYRITHVNGRGEKLLEASEDELLGETLWDIYPELEESDEIWDSLRAAMDTQTTQSRELHHEPRDNWFDVTVYPSESGLSVYFGDVTDQIQRRQELERQKERLEEFASVVSHDLRSPLTVAEGNLELAQETCESDHLARAADALDRSQTLIDDLLQLARGGETVGELEPIGLADVAERSWQTVETGSATLETHATHTLSADRSRLRELVENLYRNAVEHGGEDVTVSVGATEGGFYVADTGPGIPESDREEVFEAGYSTNEDGTGFGLRIVEQIANAHGWEITVTESEQGGARFEVTGVELADR